MIREFTVKDLKAALEDLPEEYAVTLANGEYYWNGGAKVRHDATEVDLPKRPVAPPTPWHAGYESGGPHDP